MGRWAGPWISVEVTGEVQARVEVLAANILHQTSLFPLKVSFHIYKKDLNACMLSRFSRV